MKFISVRDLRTSPAQVWEQLPGEREMVITNNGKPIALLTPLTDANLEETITAIRKAKAMNAVRSMQRASRGKGNDRLSSEDIEQEIHEARKRNKA